MVEIAERLLVEVQANTLRAQRSMEKFGKAVEKEQKKTNKNLGKLDRAFDRIGKTISRIPFKQLALATTAAATGFAFATKRALDFADRIGKTADRIGVTTDQLQELQFAASQTGVSTEQLNMGLQRFVRRVGEAAEGNQTLIKFFRTLGIEVRDSATGAVRDSIEVLKDFSDVIENTSDRNRQLALTVKLVDSEAAGLVNLFRQGRDGIEAYANEAQRLGLVMEESLIRDAERANDALDVLTRALQTQFSAGLLNLIPTIMNFVTALNAAIPRIVIFWDQLLNPTAEQSLLTLRSRIADLADEISAMEKAREGATGFEKFIRDIEQGLRDISPFSDSIAELEAELVKLLDAAEAAEGKEKPLKDLLDVLNQGLETRPGAFETGGPSQTKSVLTSLRQQAEALGTTAQQQAVLNNLRAAGIEVLAGQVSREGELIGIWNAQAQEIADITNRIFERTEAEEKARAALQERISRERDIKSIVESVRTEEERHIETLERLKKAEEEGIITKEKRIETEKRLNEQLEETKKKQREQEEALERQKDVARDVITATEQALTGSLRTWEDYGAAVLRILQNIILAQIEARNTAPGASGIFNGGFNPLGFFGSFFGSSAPTPISGGITTSPPGIQHGGTIPGGFGGGDRVPAMLEPGEEVIRKESARRFRPLLKKINAFQSGGTVGMATAGQMFGSSISLSIGTIDARGAAPGTAEQIRGVVRGELQRAAAGLNSFGRTTTQQRRNMISGIRRGVSMDAV